MEPQHFESLYPPETRKEEIEKIIQLVKAGTSCQLVGIPGAGRSNILELLAYNKTIRLKHLGENSKWFHFVYMDFSEVKKRSLEEITKFILISLSYSLAERNLREEHDEVNGFLKEATEFNDEIILFQALKKAIDYLAIQKELTIIFLCDRFDQYTPRITDQFFANLKILRNRAKYRFSVALSLARPLEDILEAPIYADFREFFIGNTVYISLADHPGLEFRRFYLEKVTGRKIEDKTDQKIIHLTGGHGKLTKIARELVLSGEIHTQDLSTHLLQKNQIQGALFEIWSTLLPAEQAMIRKSPPETNHYLSHTGLIETNTLAIPLLAQFITTLPSVIHAKIVYDAGKNEILKDGESITDLLSPSEFRLLRFLIQNADKVSEKEEIINAVWKDSKTQEGVTDQALDQIIYRLRKKIEEDPNNPRFIQTIKGRGYRFSA